MIVCICSEVRDSQIKVALASGINTMEGLKHTLDVANCCGCCEPMVNDLIDEHNAVDSLAYAV